MSTKHFYIFRHGETDWNKEKRLQGATDIPLNDTGKEQAHLLIPFLKEKNVGIIYSSPLKRAAETAQIASNGAIKIEYRASLQERNCGIIEGQTLEFARSLYNFSEDIHSFAEAIDTNSIECEGLEKSEPLLERTLKQLYQIVENDNNENIGISTHGGVIYTLLGHLGMKKFLNNGQIAEVLFKDNHFIIKEIHSL